MRRRPKRAFFSRSAGEEIDDELRFHIEGAVDELVASGLTEDEARRRVMDEFGDVGRIRDECREIAREREGTMGRENLMGSTVRDVRVAVRRLSRQPAFAGAAIVTLALGIGATVAMFSVVEGVVLRPLPYPEPERLVAVWPGANFNIAMVDYFRDAPSLGPMTGLSGWSFTLTGEGEPERVDGAAVDPEYFDVFGVHPTLGRGFTEEERYYGRADVVVLSWDFWQRRFGGDPGVIGRRIALEGHKQTDHVVVGVMPEGHSLVGSAKADVFVPLSTAPGGYTVAQDSSWYVNDVVARLAPGATVEQARIETRELARRLRADFPGRFREDYVRTADAQPLLDSVVGDVRGGLLVMLGAVALVLVIACANVANLLLARTAERGRDSALRAALGASRGRLARQSLAESLVLAVVGGGLGVLLAWWSLDVLANGVRMALPRSPDVAVSLPVLFFALAVTAGSVVLFGLLPALRGGARDVSAELRGGGGPRNTGSRGQHRLRRTLVAVEVALAVVLVAGAGLLLRSFGRLYGTDPGFRPEGVLALEVSHPGAELPGSRQGLAQYYLEVQRRLAAVPGVEDVGGIHLLPLTFGNWSFPYLAEGHEPGPDGNLTSANFRIVTPGYFRTLGIPLLQGRDVTEADGAEGPGVGLINRAMAEELWPGEDPLGKEILLFGNQPFTVVGVVGDTRQHSLDREPRPEMYRPLTQFSSGSVYMLVRGPGDMAALAPRLREAIWEVDPDVPIPFTGLVETVVADSVARARFFAVLLGGFGALALVLGAVGVYGVTAYTVASRLPEYGVRIALGAEPGSVARRAVAGGLAPVILGLAGGLAASLAAGRLLSSLLYRISPTDPVTLALVTVVLTGVAILAILVPARRASRVDPVKVLAAE